MGVTEMYHYNVTSVNLLRNKFIYFQQLKTAMLSVNEANSTVNKVVKMASEYIEPAEVRNSY